MPMLSVRFIGISCFVDGRESDTFVKRLILPTDTHGMHRGDGPHIPYVEVDIEDLAPGAEIKQSKTYTRGSRTYNRYHLDAERVSIRNASQGNGRLVVIPTFEERVPSMTLVCPDCPPTPRPECFEKAPPSDVVTAYFDVRSGYLSSGPVEEEETRFEQGSNWPVRRLAQWAQLDLAYHGGRAEILLERFDGSGTRVIPLKRDASLITVGNQREEDIEQTALKATEARVGHFSMYYDLGDALLLPKKRPQPTLGMGGVRGCAPSAWP
jgi:hypothetical protein